jgi:DNA-binding transcriptional regulator GbsR (MarR family)
MMNDHDAPSRTSDKILTSAQDRFIATWGQMGSTWGISRTMAEVHALLFITGQELCTDDVMARLEISRGNASMSLRALVDWGVVHRVHKRGDRKEYFGAQSDVWALVQAIVRERMKREVQPVLVGLHELRDMTGVGAAPADPAQAERLARHNERLDALLDLIHLVDAMGSKLAELPGEQLRATASAIAESTRIED